MSIYRSLLLATAMVGIGAFSASAEEKAEVIHWWTSGGESAAVAVFAEQYGKAGGTWIDTAIAGGANARTAGINRIVGGNPPTAMQFNTGKQFDELVANGLLRDVEDMAEAGKWREIMPKPIVDATVRDDKFYAVPINIHTQNFLFYNTEALQKAGVEAPKTFADLIAAGDKLKAAGVIPLGFSGQPNWERGLFSAVLVGEGGAQLFRDVYGNADVTAVQGASFRNVAETYAKLRDLVDSGSPGRNWNDTTAMVITGKAAMQFMGDWAKGEFIAAGQTAGKEYGCTIVGNGGELVIGGDVFVFPVSDDASVIKAQNDLAAVLLSPETQQLFNAKKGSIPVRLDVDVSGMDICAQKAAAALKDPAKQVEAMELLSPPDRTGALQDVITQYWNTPSMTVDTFVEKFVGALQTAG